MKKITNFLLLLFVMGSSVAFSQVKKDYNSKAYETFGAHFDAANILSTSQMQERYKAMKVGDTLQIAFKGDVASVCKNKGCWIKVALDNGEEVMVKFKDYAFFMPKDIEQKEVLVRGKAYISEMSVEDRRHYAQDAGKTAAEVAAITEPEITLSFLAEGVQLKK